MRRCLICFAQTPSTYGDDEGSFQFGNLSFTKKPSHGSIQFQFHRQLGALLVDFVFSLETFAYFLFHDTTRSTNVAIVELNCTLCFCACFVYRSNSNLSIITRRESFK